MRQAIVKTIELLFEILLITAMTVGILVVIEIWLMATAQAAPLTPTLRAAIEQPGIPAAWRPVLYGIAWTESSFNERAIGTQGELGAFQLHPRWHVVPVTTKDQAAYAYRLLKKYLDICGPIEYLNCYNAGPRKRGIPAARRYREKVLKYASSWTSTPNKRTLRIAADAP